MCVPECMNVYVTCVRTYRGQKRVLGSLELDLVTFVSHPVSTGN